MLNAQMLYVYLLSVVIPSATGYMWPVESVFNCSKVKCQGLCERRTERGSPLRFVACRVMEMKFGLFSGCVAFDTNTKKTYLISTGRIFANLKLAPSISKDMGICIEHRCDRYCGAMHQSDGICKVVDSDYIGGDIRSRHGIDKLDERLITCICKRLEPKPTTTTTTTPTTTTTTTTTIPTTTTTTTRKTTQSTTPTTTTRRTTPTTKTRRTTPTTTTRRTTKTTTTSTTTTTTTTRNCPNANELETLKRGKFAKHDLRQLLARHLEVITCDQDVCARICHDMWKSYGYPGGACNLRHPYPDNDRLINFCFCGVATPSGHAIQQVAPVGYYGPVCNDTKCHQWCDCERGRKGICERFPFGDSKEPLPSCKCS